MVELELEFRHFDSQSSGLSMVPEVFHTHTVLIDGELEKPSHAQGHSVMALSFTATNERTWAWE